MVSLKAIEASKNITILTDDDSFGNASALYTYILRLHKKVSLVNQNIQLSLRLSCVPWYEKVKRTVSSSSDLIINLQDSKESLYTLFIENNVIINKKMATALYASHLQKFDYSSEYIHILSDLIHLGAEYEVCNLWIKKSLPLSLIRLKVLLLRTLVVYDEGKIAVISMKDLDLQQSGATINEVVLIMQEALDIVHVQKVVLIDSENENKLIKII